MIVEPESNMSSMTRMFLPLT